MIVDQPGTFTLTSVRIGSQGSVSEKDLCKEDGWKTMQTPDGKSFKNQGSCVSYHASSANNKAKRVVNAVKKQVKD